MTIDTQPPARALPYPLGELGAAMTPVAHAATQTAPVTSIARRSVARQLTDEVDAVAQRDVVTGLVGGWRASRALVDAAHRTATDPALREVVDLQSQTISHATHPSIGLYVDAVEVATIDVTVTLDIAIVGLSAVVQDAAVTNVEIGTCTVTLTVADARGDRLFSRAVELHSLADIDLPRAIPLLTARHVTA